MLLTQCEDKDGSLIVSKKTSRRNTRSGEIALVVEYTFLIDDKGVNFVTFYDQTQPGVEFSVTNT